MRTSVPAIVGTSSALRSTGPPRIGATPAAPTLVEGILTVFSSGGKGVGVDGASAAL